MSSSSRRPTHAGEPDPDDNVLQDMIRAQRRPPSSSSRGGDRQSVASGFVGSTVRPHRPSQSQFSGYMPSRRLAEGQARHYSQSVDPAEEAEWYAKQQAEDTEERRALEERAVKQAELEQAENEQIDREAQLYKEKKRSQRRAMTSSVISGPRGGSSFQGSDYEEADDEVQRGDSLYGAAAPPRRSRTHSVASTRTHGQRPLGRIPEGEFRDFHPLTTQGGFSDQRSVVNSHPKRSPSPNFGPTR
jgi:hypothetical protein